jgi:hypothetical protein
MSVKKVNVIKIKKVIINVTTNAEADQLKAFEKVAENITNAAQLPMSYNSMVENLTERYNEAILQKNANQGTTAGIHYKAIERKIGDAINALTELEVLSSSTPLPEN